MCQSAIRISRSFSLVIQITHRFEDEAFHPCLSCCQCCCLHGPAEVQCTLLCVKFCALYRRLLNSFFRFPALLLTLNSLPSFNTFHASPLRTFLPLDLLLLVLLEVLLSASLSTQVDLFTLLETSALLLTNLFLSVRSTLMEPSKTLSLEPSSP